MLGDHYKRLEEILNKMIAQADNDQGPDQLELDLVDSPKKATYAPTLQQNMMLHAIDQGTH